ncbi:conserved hypothetical protein [Thiomonas arsenitoxydans]|uniref:Uncharacterized protein n=2 Tax=Thiomonas arsenitoxydans (strain DSM 22701 / CIP 110005 / 3As) TaxID=426114 RepID=D6CTM5_THIA3|nr:hypothetical protein THI_1981 [Thiomonas arsenitoxydans]CQR44484.1 conserved hypothetical protein [Thiomonas sp. CB3]CQR27764.1 conserved hypothetical protein [Thiomonas arsenitoxydans]CQR32011.1 conserved hypothetical protein [Thiomonas arsenitoxydans]CQR34726.1 conserved hypothetical protein [Thiomonas arsenitoxydans]
MLVLALSPARAVGEQFWQALMPPQEKNDRGLLPAAVRLIARLTAAAAAIVVPADVLLLSSDLTRSPLLESIFTQFFDFLLPASLVCAAGLVFALLLLAVGALGAAVGAYKGEFAPRDAVGALRHLISRVIPPGVAIAISAAALSTLSAVVLSVFEAALRKLGASLLRMRVSWAHARQPVRIRARTITHLCLSPRLLAQRPFAARALRVATSS